IRRRIERRMTALGLPDLDTYASHVREEPDEVKLLFRDMMISVTSFFRDIEEFENFREHLKVLVEDRSNHGMRIWVPGCASGEEAYTIMILIAESLGGVLALDQTQIQLFATDIDADALAKARRGRYPKTAEKDIPAEYLEKYFMPTDDGYQVNQSLRERIVFTPHNLCQDPPFSNIDLISCRNLLIYFNNTLQAKVFARLHYALKSSGLLFLGKSESISGSEALFRLAGDGGQIFQRRARSDRVGLPRTHSLGVTPAGYMGALQRTPEKTEPDAFGSMFRALVRAIGPNGLLVTSDLHIMRVYGNVDRFLSLSEGQLRGATINMLRDELRHELRTLIALSLRNKETRQGLVRPLEQGSDMRLQLQVHPIGDVEDADGMVLVVFKEWKEERPAIPALPDDDDAARGRVVELEEELLGTRESLQQTVEELETANEELQSLNEELQSANEELQSTNEELETTNEELQSTNEELITVNEELQINSHEMAAINQELDSILSNIAAPVLVVDTRLHIVQCSQSARQMFKISSGVAKPHLSQLSLPGEFPALNAMMAQVVQTGTRLEQDIDMDGFHGTVTAAPYFNSKGELIGATAIVQEVTATDSKAIEALLDNLPLMIWRQDGDGKVVDANEAAERFMGLEPGAAIGLALDAVRERLGETFVTSSINLPSPAASQGGTGNGSLHSAIPHGLANGHEPPETVVVVAADVANQVTGTETGLPWDLSSADRHVELPPETATRLGLGNAAASLGLENFLDVFHRDDRAALSHGISSALSHSIPFTVLARLASGQGAAGRLRVRGRAEKDDDGGVVGIGGTVGGN
ncbi:MAG: CheR family methyltransferase, partial [Pseudomonadota bacterium]